MARFIISSTIKLQTKQKHQKRGKITFFRRHGNFPKQVICPSFLSVLFRFVTFQVLPERDFRFAFFFGFDSGTEEFLEKSFFDEPIDDAVIEDRVKIELLHLCADLFICLIIDHIFHGRRQNVRHALVDVLDVYRSYTFSTSAGSSLLYAR